jgi:hypothetical protein
MLAATRNVPVKRAIRQAILRYLSSTRVGNALIRAIRSYREPVSLSQFGDARELFSHYAAANVWGEAESVSGPGSTLAYTENIRREIPRIVEQFGVRRLLDAPCGDYNWFRLVKREPAFDYIGGDIVESLVKQNNSRHGNAQTRFVALDIRHDRLPDADLWFCRDCFQHLSEYDIALALDNFVRSGIPYLLTSTYPDCEVNSDGPTGSSRRINLLLPPFGFGEPITMVDDWLPGVDRRCMGVWDRRSVAVALNANRVWQRMKRPQPAAIS